MAELIDERTEPVAAGGGRQYLVRVRGASGAEGFWHGWLEFDDRGGAPLRTEQETVQRDRAALAAWAAGLEATYLAGALERARRLRVAPALQRRAGAARSTTRRA